MLKTINQNGIELKMNVETEFENHRFDSFFVKEPETLAWIKTIMKPEDTFFDIGANVGVYSLFAKAVHGSQMRVFSFEPAYHNFEKLCRNIIDNKFSNIMPYCVAISDKMSLQTIELASNISGSASHLLSSAPKQLFENFTSQFEQGVFTISLDGLIEDYGFIFPNHIKIDVDGVEELIIKGAKNTLKNKNLKSVLIELTDEDGAKERIKDMFYNAGFKSDHPVNFHPDSMRERRQRTGKLSSLENVIFTR
ncbi:FkbM family methyltransferase [Candidatus Parcubacteria bacterium]|nr:FkbM family methyltransferase [Candidatus Parcubacteria bacterium]MCG2694416.1 FkbM family methyltransferase [Candidatus Parcubacteria bacterium]